MNKGVIRHSFSDYASPIVIVKKKKGTNRLCIDYRKLIEKTIKDRYSLHLFDEIIEDLYDAFLPHWTLRICFSMSM